jgi:hypothetical protein
MDIIARFRRGMRVVTSANESRPTIQNVRSSVFVGYRCRTFVITIFSCLAVTYLVTAAEEPLDKILIAVDSKGFMDGLFAPASGVAGVEFQASRSPEVRYLVQHSAQAIPQMLQRLKTPDGIRYRLTPIVYFIVFKEAKDPRVLPALADYLDSIPEKDKQPASSYFEENPFIYAVRAVEAFIPLRHDTSDDPFLERHRIASQLRTEFKHRVPQ